MTAEITPDDVRYCIEIVEKVCTEIGPGLPGTSQERARANLLKRELESHLGAENVQFEEFSLAPDAFLGSYKVSAVLILVSAMLNFSAGNIRQNGSWITALFALVLSILAVLIIVFEYIQYKEVIDWFFPQKQSVNVIGRLKKPGTKEVKRLLLLSGHLDSAPANTWITFLRYGFFVSLPTIFMAMFLMIILSIIQLAGTITISSDLLHFGTLRWELLVFPIVPAVIFAFFFTYGKRNGGIVPGAVDNLSACASAIAMCRFLVRNPDYIPADTEIRFVLFGGEEAGLRGSRRYVARHLDELKRLDARLLNFESIAFPKIIIPYNDVNGVKNSPEMIDSVRDAAERAEVPFQVSSYPMGGGGSDAGPFSQAGLKAATLLPLKFPQQIVAFYHQKLDTPKILTSEPLLNVLKLTLDWIRHDGC